MAHTARPFVLHEATFSQVKKLAPNVAVQPWGAEEAHNYHLPHGTDCIQATAISEVAVAAANAKGARCILLPCVPYGNDNLQLSQAATITMRSATQHAVLFDIADSLVRQGIDRLVLIDGHGGNDFIPMIRDIMLELPIFIVRIKPYGTAPKTKEILENTTGDHANEMETSLMLHLKPEWVAPLETAGDGAVTPSKLPLLTGNPGVWAPRHWASATQSTGIGDPRKGTAAKGKYMFDAFAAALADILAELSAAKNGDFPFIVGELRDQVDRDYRK
ncbi:MAG: creatininase family protein [Phycisphaerales bacterium]|nr:creatininase family protein [Phycisphaerales bacterium]